ncbi:MAG: hypothetical protein JWR74_2853 [Polaromonas sp.]|nr:hypothetical protein [Polaromonas sp.]
MNLAGLIAQYRIDGDDVKTPYRADDEAVMAWLNDATVEACIRGRLLHESGNAAICQIAVAADVRVYALHPALYEISHIAYKATGATWREPLELASAENLDRVRPGWRDCAGRAEFAIQSDTAIRLAFTPSTAGILYVEGYRLPLAPLVDMVDVPEINAAHHIKLVLWALHKGFSVPDSQMVDPARAAQAEKAFTGYFGLRPDADLRRATRHDEVQHNPAFWG